MSEDAYAKAHCLFERFEQAGASGWAIPYRGIDLSSIVGYAASRSKWDEMKLFRDVREATLLELEGILTPIQDSKGNFIGWQFKERCRNHRQGVK